LFKDLSRITVV